MNKVRASALAFIAFTLTACQNLSTRHESLYPIPGAYSYSVPESLGDGLRTGPIQSELFNPERMSVLEGLLDAIKQGAFGEIHGLLIVHDGRLVLEEYFPGYLFKGGKIDFTAATPHHLASVTKSLTSLCVGIAIDKGFVKSVDQPVLDYYGDLPVADREAKKDLTVRHLLTMTSGLEWDESTYPYTDLRNDVVRLYLSPDPLASILDLKMIAPPGTVWKYNGACPNLLGDIVERSSALSLDTFAERYLYAPLGIVESSWIKLGKGFIYASGDAELRPRDMVKIGMLVLNGGTWNGERVVSKEWLNESMTKVTDVEPAVGYGFAWWLPELPMELAKTVGPVYLASGWGGQYIAIVPKLDVVLVLTGGNYYFQAPDLVDFMLRKLFG